jgi:hypothetical protein
VFWIKVWAFAIAGPFRRVVDPFSQRRLTLLVKQPMESRSTNSKEPTNANGVGGLPDGEGRRTSDKSNFADRWNR